MKKKLYITRTIKLIAFALALLSVTYLLQAYVLKRNDNNTLRMDGFYLEDKNSLDVVLIGASDVYAGFASPLAYDKYGFTSYPYATQSAPPNIVLPQIKEVIKYQNPQMIVVEINAFLYKDYELPTDASNRMFVDNIPYDEVKMEYIETNYAPDERIEYYLPLIKYHGSWSDYPWKFKYLITDLRMRKRGYSLFRGYKTVANQFKSPVAPLNGKLADDDSKKPLAVAGQRYLIELLDYLQANDIHNVVFTRFPHIVSQDAYSRFQRCNTAGDIIKSYGYDFINLERYGEQEGFEVDHDYYNWDHLNIYGSEKLTHYFSKLLVNNYGVIGSASKLSEENKAGWQDSVDHYYMIYHYSEAMIKRRLELGKTGNGGTTVSEDEKSIATIEKYKKNHPDKFVND